MQYLSDLQSQFSCVSRKFLLKNSFTGLYCVSNGSPLKMIKVSKAIPWAIFDSVSSGLLGLLTLALLTRTLTANDFGIVTFVQSIVVLVQLVTTLGLNEALIQRRPINALYLDSAFWAGLLLGCAGFLFCVCLATILGFNGDNTQLPSLLVIEGTACIFAGINLVPNAMLDRNLQTKIVAKRTFFGKLTYCVVAILLAYLNFSVWSLVLAGLAQNIITTYILWSVHTRRPHFRISFDHIKILTSFGAFIMLEGILWSCSTRAFFLLVGSYHGLQALGNVNVAIRVGDAIAAVISTVSNRIGFAFFSSIQHDPCKLADSFKRATELICLVSWPVFMGLVLTSGEWVPLLLGQKWLTAVPLVNLVCVVWMISFSRIFAGPYLRAIGCPRALLLPAFLSAIVTVIAVLATQNKPIILVMLAWSSRCFVTFPIGIILQRRSGNIQYKDQLGPMVRPLFSVICMALGVLAWRFLFEQFLQSENFYFLSSIFVGVALYGAIMLIGYRLQIRKFLKRDLV